MVSRGDIQEVPRRKEHPMTLHEYIRKLQHLEEIWGGNYEVITCVQDDLSPPDEPFMCHVETSESGHLMYAGSGIGKDRKKVVHL